VEFTGQCRAQVVRERHRAEKGRRFLEQLRREKIAQQQRFMDNTQVEPTQDDDGAALPLAGAPIYQHTHARMNRNVHLTHGRKSQVSY
jgi:hypothetical protein